MVAKWERDGISKAKLGMLLHIHGDLHIQKGEKKDQVGNNLVPSQLMKLIFPFDFDLHMVRKFTVLSSNRKENT
jgi:hypothetical protein